MRPERLSRRPAFSARALLALAATLAAALLTAPPAFAHASLLGSSPGAGARLGSAPGRIELRFTEGINRSLSRASLTDIATHKRVPAAVSHPSATKLVLRPEARLGRAAYRVDWRSVSSDDGHELEGWFSFGVRTAAEGGSHQLGQSPLTSGGWLRILFRASFYAALLFFAGGLVLGSLLGRGGPPGSWLLPPELRRNGSKPPSPIAELAWRRTQTAGWLAASAAVAVSLADAARAGGGLSAHTLSSFLLSSQGGVARLVVVGTLLVAASLTPRWPRLAGGAVLVAVAAVALSGHANSAHPRGLALTTDWLHLVAAAVWVGGIAQIVLTWGPRLRAAGGELRFALMRSVLPRFGRVALPAFALVVASGLANALIQLGSVSQLWQSAYGRALAVKMTLVALIAGVSYLHALRLRPRLATATSAPQPRVERRHWRLLRSEPAIGLAVAVAAAVLVAFPLPPRQLEQSAQARAAVPAPAPCNPCAQQAPRGGQLSVAENVGSTLAAVWIEPAGRGLRGRLRLYGLNLVPVRAQPRIGGASLAPCGPGCFDFTTVTHPPNLVVSLPEKGRLYSARLPAVWQPSQSRPARALLDRAQATMRRLRSLRDDEVISSGPGASVQTYYRLKAPDRFAYVTGREGRTVVVGQAQWDRQPGGVWQKSEYGGGPPPFRTRSWFTWTSYARAVRLLDRTAHGADLALMDPATPVWFRLHVELPSMRVTSARMIADGHFMSERYYAFNQPLSIEPPREP